MPFWGPTCARGLIRTPHLHVPTPSGGCSPPDSAVLSRWGSGAFARGAGGGTSSRCTSHVFPSGAPAAFAGNALLSGASSLQGGSWSSSVMPPPLRPAGSAPVPADLGSAHNLGSAHLGSAHNPIDLGSAYNPIDLGSDSDDVCCVGAGGCGAGDMQALARNAPQLVRLCRDSSGSVRASCDGRHPQQQVSSILRFDCLQCVIIVRWSPSAAAGKLALEIHRAPELYVYHPVDKSCMCVPAFAAAAACRRWALRTPWRRRQLVRIVGCSDGRAARVWAEAPSARAFGGLRSRQLTRRCRDAPPWTFRGLRSRQLSRRCRDALPWTLGCLRSRQLIRCCGDAPSHACKA